MTDPQTQDYRDNAGMKVRLAEENLEAMALAFVAGVRSAERQNSERDSALAFSGAVLEAKPEFESLYGQSFPTRCAEEWKAAWERMGFSHEKKPKGVKNARR